MRLRRLRIENYRGIRKLDWALDAPFVCLVGPGDSTKSTVLDAIGLVLSSRYNLIFTDADFFSCDTTRSIRITAVITDLPDKLVEERTHGKNRSGIRANGELEHDPLDEAGIDECLIVRLSVDATLEPVWEVVRPEVDEGDRITASERAELGFFRVGDRSDSNLRWSRGSALSSLTASNTEATYAVVEAQRQARAAVASLAGTPLHEASLIVQTDAMRLGSAEYTDLRPGLDPSLSSTAAALVLHEGPVPLTQYGLGSRRLTSLAIQEKALAARSIVAIDEIEHGLEPHRLLSLTRYLLDRSKQGALQVIVTTHAPSVVETLSGNQLFVVRAQDGETTVTGVPPVMTDSQADTLQGMVRERPSALLARRVLVGEGQTEVGMLRALLSCWDTERSASNASTSVVLGVTVTNGSGDSRAPARAEALASLGYPTLLMLDGDVITNAAAVSAATVAGVNVIQWAPGQALEDVVVTSFGLPGLQQFVEAAADEVSEESVLSTVGRHLGDVKLRSLEVASWVTDHGGEEPVRAAIAKASKGAKVGGDKQDTKSWFKREDRGERLGRLIFAERPRLANTELARQLLAVKNFVYGADETAKLASDEATA